MTLAPRKRSSFGSPLAACTGRRLALALAASLALIPTLLVGRAGSTTQQPGLIAFVRADGVFVMRTDGSGTRRLRRTQLWTVWASWSPDGRRLAFVSYVDKGGIWIMSSDGSHLRRLEQVSIALSRPTWSPDGRRIAFAGRGIWLVNSDGSNLRRLRTPGLARCGDDVDWSPVGERIAFSCGAAIYVMNTDGSHLRRLTSSGRSAPSSDWSSEPDWSPDGRRIVFTRAVRSCAGCILERRNEEIYVMNADGSSQVRLTDNHVPDYSPVWSPDGGRIAFVGAYAGRDSAEIYVMNADGSGRAQLTRNRVSEGSPAWQPVVEGSSGDGNALREPAGRVVRPMLASSAARVAMEAGIASGFDAAAAATAVTYSDPVGDVTIRGAADLTSVRVSSARTTVSFRLTLAKPLVRRIDSVGVLIDVPPGGPWPNPYNMDGVDYALGVTGAATRGDGMSFSSGKRWSFPAVRRGRSVTFSIGRRQLGRPAWLNFVAVTSRWSPDGTGVTPGVDTAPAWMRGTFFYRLSD